MRNVRLILLTKFHDTYAIKVEVNLLQVVEWYSKTKHQKSNFFVNKLIMKTIKKLSCWKYVVMIHTLGLSCFDNYGWTFPIYIQTKVVQCYASGNLYTLREIKASIFTTVATIMLTSLSNVPVLCLKPYKIIVLL